MRTLFGSRPVGLSLKLAALVASASLAAACSGGSTSEGSSAGDGEVIEGGTPKNGGVLVQAYTADAKSLDLHKESAFPPQIAVGPVYNRLLGYKTGPKFSDGTQELEP